MSYSVYRQFSPPTTAEHCVSTRFTTTARGATGEIAVSRRSLLQIYWVLDDTAPQGDGFSQQDLFTQDAALELRAEYQLSGNIESMCVVPYLSKPSSTANCEAEGLPEPGLDSLLLTFESGKAVLVAHDPNEVGALRTLAMFNFEQEALASGLQARKGGTVSRHGYGERATALVDPSYKCAVMLLYGSQLCVIPFRTERTRQRNQLLDSGNQNSQGNTSEEVEAENRARTMNAKETTNTLHQNAKVRLPIVVAKNSSSLWESSSNSIAVDEPFMVRMPLKGIPEGAIRDMVFLHGYQGQTCALAVLHSDIATSWAGRASARRYTCVVSVFSLSPHQPLERSNFTLVWRVKQLPHDAFKLVATQVTADSELRTSSVLVFSANAIQLIGPTKSSRFSIAVNGNAEFTVDTERFPLHDVNGEIDGGSIQNNLRVSFILSGIRSLWLDPKNLLMSNVDTGELMKLSLVLQRNFKKPGEQSQVLLQLHMTGKSNPAMGLCLVKQLAEAMNSDEAFGANDNRFEDEGEQIVNEQKKEILGEMAMAQRVYVFLASRYSDSLLIEVLDKSERSWKPPPLKRIRFEEDEIEHLQQQDIDVLLYGNTLVQEPSRGEGWGQIPAQFEFVVRDRLASSGPVTSITYAQSLSSCHIESGNSGSNEIRRILQEADNEAKALASKGMHSAAAGVRLRANMQVEEHQKALAQRAIPVDHEFVLSTGRGANGSIRKVQWGSRCDTLAEVELDNAVAVWSLASSVEIQGNKGRTRRAVDLVVVSLQTKTRILRTSADGMHELDDACHDFDVTGPTLFAGSMGKHLNWVLQVVPNRLRLAPLRCEGEGSPAMVTEISRDTVVRQSNAVYERVTGRNIPMSSPEFVSVSVCSPYVLLTLDNGHVHLMKFQEPASGHPPQLTPLQQPFLDDFVRSLLGQDPLRPPPRVATLVSGSAALPFLRGTEAGDLDASGLASGTICVLCRSGLTEPSAGTVEAVHVPDGRLLFRSHLPLALGPTLLRNAAGNPAPEKAAGSNLGLMANALVMDLTVALVGDQDPNKGDGAFKLRRGGDLNESHAAQTGSAQRIVPPAVCLVAALSNGDLLVYRARRQSALGRNTECVLERVQYSAITRGLRAKSSPERRPLPPCAALQGPGEAFRFPLLFPFRALTRLGVFAASVAPVWLLGTRGQVRVVPLDTGARHPLPLPVQRARHSVAAAPAPARPASSSSIARQDEGRASLEADSLGQVALGPHANTVRGSIVGTTFLRSLPDAFLMYYGAPASPASTRDATASLARLQTPEQAGQSALRLCVFAGYGSDLAAAGALTGAARWTSATAQRVELDQSGGGNTVMMQSANIGDTVHSVLYVDHASRGASHEEQEKAHNPVYSLLVARRMRAPELPNASLAEEDRDVVVGPDGEREIQGIEEGFALRPDVFKSRPGTGGAPLLEDVRGVVALYAGGDLSKPCDEFVLNPYERGLCQRVVEVQTMQSTSERKYLAVGTGFIIPEGEDRGCKGRVLLFEIIHVQAEGVALPGRPSTLPKLRLISDRVSLISKKEPRGPVTAVASAFGKLLIAMGNMPSAIKLCHVDENDKAVVPHKFYDTPICVSSMEVFKNFILVGDIHKSFRLIHLQKSNRDFHLLLKSNEAIKVYCTNVLITGTKVSLTIADSEGNLQLYSPQRPLQCVADFHLGSHCLDMERVLLRKLGSESEVSAQTAKQRKLDFGLYFGTLDGAFGALVPIDEIVFRRLYALQAAMMRCEQVRHNANLNARGFRMFKTPGGMPLERHRVGNIADGVLLQSYSSLNYSLQRTLARMIGTTTDTVLDSLMEIELATRW